VVPEPLTLDDPRQIRAHPNAGFDDFGDYTECGQVIPVNYQGQAGGYTAAAAQLNIEG
jgi:acetoacetate decarboxylase